MNYALRWYIHMCVCNVCVSKLNQMGSPFVQTFFCLFGSIQQTTNECTLYLIYNRLCMDALEARVFVLYAWHFDVVNLSNIPLWYYNYLLEKYKRFPEPFENVRCSAPQIMLMPKGNQQSSFAKVRPNYCCWNADFVEDACLPRTLTFSIQPIMVHFKMMPYICCISFDFAGVIEFSIIRCVIVCTAAAYGAFKFESIE